MIPIPHNTTYTDPEQFESDFTVEDWVDPRVPGEDEGT